MAAPKNNDFYKLRKTDGKPKELSPDDLFNLWKEFVSWAKENPVLSYQVVQKSASVIPLPIERPLSLNEFFSWVDDTYEITVHQYFDNEKGAYDDYLGITTRIRAKRNASLEVGSISGIFNSNISNRILGLSDKTENKTEINGNIKTETKADLSKLTTEELIALDELQKKVGLADGEQSTDGKQ